MFEIGDRVIKNPETWIPSDFDRWGSDVGIGTIVEPPWEHEDGVIDDGDGEPFVDVRWPAGRCFKLCIELKKVE